MNPFCISFLVLLAVSSALAADGMSFYNYRVEAQIGEGSTKEIEKIDLYFKHPSLLITETHVPKGKWQELGIPQNKPNLAAGKRLGSRTHIEIPIDAITGFSWAWSARQSDTEPKPLKVSRIIITGKDKLGSRKGQEGKSVEFCYNGPTVKPGQKVDMVKCN